MKVNVKEFLEESGITEPFYPGKRLVQPCKQTGEFKSHCLVLDWRDPDKIRIEVKAGLSGKDLAPERLKYYPVSFQTPTYVEIEVVNDNADGKSDDEQAGGNASSSSSGGSGGLKKKASLNDMKSVAFQAFGDAIKSSVPEIGKIVDMMVMGVKIAAGSYARVMDTLSQQIKHAKISTTELLAQAGKFVTKYTPPSFMKPTGDEDAVYKYDREKNADIGYRPGMV